MESLSDHEIARLGFKAVQEGDVDKLETLIKAHRSPFPLEWRSVDYLRSYWINGTSKAETIMSEVSNMNVEAVLEHRSDYAFLLTTAIYSCNLQVIERLLEAGAAVNGTDFRGWSPLGNVARICKVQGSDVRQKQLEIAELLLKRGADPNVANTRNGVPLVKAVSGNQESLIKLLLSYGADINKPDESGDNVCTPLCKAIRGRYHYCQWSIVSLLLGYKPRIDSGEISKVISFKQLAEYDKMVSVFKENNVTAVDVLNRADGNKLFVAIREGDVEVVEESLKRDDQIVKGVGKALTPLHVAVFYKQEEVVKVLIANGADILCEDGYGKTPVDYATENYDGSMLMTFFSMKPCFRDSLLFSAAKSGSLSALEHLIRAGANMFAQDDRGHTPLHRAVYHQAYDPDSVKLLLVHGADPNILDENGANALCSACHDGFDSSFADLLEVLLNYGVDVNTVVDKHGNTSFTSTANFDMSDYDEINNFVDCLLRLAKWRAAGLRVSEKNFEVWEEMKLDDDPIVQGYLSRYEREVMLMKQERVNPLVRLHDVLAASQEQLAKLAGDEDLTKSVLSGRYARKYPNYNDLITAKFQIGKTRRRFLEKGREVLQCIWPDLPILVREAILQNLSNKDVFLLARSTSTDEPHDESCCCRRPIRP